MVTFFTTLLLTVGIMLVSGVPVLIICWRRRLGDTARRFLVAAGVIGLVSAAIAASSERLVNQCRNAGNPECLDFGSSGFVLLLVGGYVVASLGKAVAIHRD